MRKALSAACAARDARGCVSMAAAARASAFGTARAFRVITARYISVTSPSTPRVPSVMLMPGLATGAFVRARSARCRRPQRRSGSWR